MQKYNNENLLKNILIIKKDLDSISAIKMRHDFNILKISDIKNLEELLNNYQIDLIISENDYLDYLNNLKIEIPILGIGFYNDKLINQAIEKGCIDYITIPINNKLIGNRIITILKSVNNENNPSEFDPITGLLTKEAFETKCHSFLNRNPEEKFDIMCVDFKNFKLFNNRHGSKQGNRLLKFASDKIKLRLYNSDLISRITADIFVMLVPRPFKYHKSYFEQEIEAINEFPCDEELLINFGIYQIKNNNEEVRSMYDKAIIACNSIKDNYIKHYAIYTESLLEDIENQDFLTLSYKEAFIKKQFKVFYQPKYSMNNEMIAGAEALVRWEHPSRGFISPEQFIPHFEKIGIITALDYYIWEKVCQDIKMWSDEGIDLVPISVNVSRIDLLKKDLFEFITSLTERYDINRNLLHLEITESAYTKDNYNFIKIIKKLQNAGFIIEMDDFGSGYSSLNSISELPIDIIKLDMKFIDSLNSKAGRRVVDFIRDLATSLNISITAEGVESAGQLKKLNKIKCDYVQGHYYARPMIESDFKKQLILNSVLNNSYKQATKNFDKNIKIVENLNAESSILIIDNNQIPTTKLIDILKNNYTIFISNNSESALNFLKYEYRNISAIIIKFIDNEMHNWNLIEKLRKNQLYENLPLLISTSDDKYIIQRAYQSGVNDVFSEPIIPVSVLKRLDTVIKSSLATVSTPEDIKLLQQSHTDILSGLNNRRGFDKNFNNLIMQEKRINCALFIIEIDNFNEYFTEYGMDAADKKIIEFSNLLKKSFRTADILSRISTNKFITVMTDSDNESIVRKKAESLTQKTHLLDISCSAGIVLFNSESVNRQQLLALAEKSLTIAKNRGMNCSEIIKIK